MLGGGSDGRALDHHQVQADPQRGIGTRAPDGVGGGRRGDHQAGGLQDAVAMGPLDPLVDGLGQAEIVGGEGEPPQRHACSDVTHAA